MNSPTRTPPASRAARQRAMERRLTLATRAVTAVVGVLLVVLVSGSRLSFRLIGELLRGQRHDFRRSAEHVCERKRQRVGCGCDLQPCG